MPSPNVQDDQATESADSEDVQPSGSGYLDDDVEQESSLDQDFPSVPKLMTSLSTAYIVDKDPTSFRSLAQVFANTVATVCANIECSARIDRSSEKFIFARSIIHLQLAIFRDALDKVARGERVRSDRLFAVRDAYEHAGMVHDSLRCLYLIGLEKPPTDIDKPLPPLPKHKHKPKPISPPRNTSTTTLRLKQPTPSPNDKSLKWPLPSPRTPRPPTPTTPRPATPKPSSPKTPTPKPPTPTPTPNTPTPATPTFPEQIYNQRWTALYFGPTSFDLSLPSTPLSEGLKLDPLNRIRAASLPALIRILTSQEGVQDPAVTRGILMSFRLFASPGEFLGTLRAQFECVGAEGGTDVQTRVLAVLYTWLDQHWKPDTDGVVLDDIRAFVQHVHDESQVMCECSSLSNISHISRSILTKLAELEYCTEQDIFDRQLANIAASSVGQQSLGLNSSPLGQRTGFVVPDALGLASDSDSSPSTPLVDALDLLDTDEGREEISRHLTLKMSSLYRRLDPGSVVRFWCERGERARECVGVGGCERELNAGTEGKAGGEGGGGGGGGCLTDVSLISAYSEQLTLWVISSVVECDDSDLQKRVKVLVFWTDVASRCLAHNDYATAHNLYACLNYSSILRLKETILAIPEPTKMQYKTLSAFFDDRTNALFKRTFDDLVPTIASTAPLLQDIIRANARAEARQSGILGPRPSHEQHTGADTTSEPKPKLIPFDQCKAAQRAIRYLNKALIPYPFETHPRLMAWLDASIGRFHIPNPQEKERTYRVLHESSLRIEPRTKELDFIACPWHYTSSNASDPLRGRIVPLDMFLPAPLEQKKAAKRLLGLIGDLRRVRR